MARELIDFGSDARPVHDDETLVEYYIDVRGKQLQSSTKRETKSAWRLLERFLESSNVWAIDITDNKDIENIEPNTVIDWIEYLRNDRQDSTISTYVSKLSSMVSWLNDRSIASGNPFSVAKESVEFDTESTPKVYASDDNLREAILDINNPLTLAIVVLLLKTGLRIAELTNLNERDINLDHPISNRLEDNRPSLNGKPNTIYIDSSVTDSDVADNSNDRKNPTKPNSTRIVPLDDDTVDVLGWYLSLRPAPNSELNPVFVNEYGSNRAISCTRMSVNVARNRFTDWADANGWYDANNTGSIKPHWCRHWFTTTLRTNIDEDMIEVGNEDDYLDYLRGDTSSETKSDYIQMGWGNNHWMRSTLNDALPSLIDNE
jgi:integrase